MTCKAKLITKLGCSNLSLMDVWTETSYIGEYVVKKTDLEPGIIYQVNVNDTKDQFCEFVGRV